ncbi:MAG: cupin domain-containing protein [Flavobacteriales bacterium]|nr:cupin domain-containing protein [Flavobacteriales bacterium]
MKRNQLTGLMALGAGSLLALTYAFTTPNTNDAMLETMIKSEAKSFDKPDTVRTFPKGRVELVTIGGATIGRAIFEPGWRWSTSVMPIAKTKSCEAPHFQYHVAGVLHVKMDDGTEYDLKPGDVSLLPSGHDAWTVGNEAAIVIDFQGMVDYASAGHKH